MGVLSAVRDYLNPYVPAEPSEARALEAWGDWQPSQTKTVNNETALTLSAVWACQTLIADSIATLPQDVFRAQKDGSRVEAPGPKWLREPNPYTDVVDFDTQRVLSLLGWGECYVLLVREGGMAAPAPIVERWVIDPARVKIEGRTVFVDNKPMREGDIQRIIGYRLPGHDRGMSLVRYGAGSFGLGLAAEKYDIKFMENGAVASGVLQVPALAVDASKDVVDRLREQFAQRHASVNNMHKPIVLTGGTTWAQTTINPEDAQLLETRKFQVSDVARWHRVPPHMIGDVDRSTSWGTGIEVQGVAFVVYTLNPWIIRLERADSALLPQPQFVKRNVNALVRGDMAARREWYTAGLNGQYLTVEEIRAWEELPPLPEDPGFPDPADNGGPPDGSE